MSLLLMRRWNPGMNGLGADKWKWPGGKAGDVDAEGHPYGSAKSEAPAQVAMQAPPQVAAPANVVDTPLGPVTLPSVDDPGSWIPLAIAGVAIVAGVLLWRKYRK